MHTLTRRSAHLGGLALAGSAVGVPGRAGAQVRSHPHFARFAEIEARIGGRLGVSALRLGEPTGWLAHRHDEAFPLCSTFKWLLAAAEFELGPLQRRRSRPTQRRARGDRAHRCRGVRLMAWFRLLACGENFPIVIDGNVEIVGFYTTRYIHAESQGEAEAIASELLFDDEDLRPPPGDWSDLRSSIVFEEAERVAEPIEINDGFYFFPMDEAEED